MLKYSIIYKSKQNCHTENTGHKCNAASYTLVAQAGVCAVMGQEYALTPPAGQMPGESMGLAMTKNNPPGMGTLICLLISSAAT